MTGLTLLWIRFRRNAVSVTHPGQSMISRFLRVALYARRIFMTHAATLRVRAVGHSMFLFVVMGMICRARGWAVTHDTVFWRVFAVVTDQTIFHPPVYFMAVQVFPVGYAGVTAGALVFFMFFMGKIEAGCETLAGSHGFTRLFEVAEAAVTFFACFEMAFKASRFARPPKSIVDVVLVGKNATRI